MKKLSIVTYPEKILKRKAGTVSQIGSEILQLISRMIEAMYTNEGIGLAAPQIGISKQIIIIETSGNPKERKEEHRQGVLGNPATFINPIITSRSKETNIEEEGCLSLPEIFIQVKRAETIKVTCQTPEGETVKIEASGLIARIFQHEVDHLNGKLIIDHLPPLKRLKMRRQLRKISKQSK